MKAVDLLKKLGYYIGVQTLKPDKFNVCSLMFDQLVTLHLQPAPEGHLIHVYSWVGQASQAHKLQAWEALLAANLFGYALDGAYFGIYEGNIFLCQQVALGGLDFDTFVQGLEHFIHHAEIWIKRLEAFMGTAAEPIQPDRPKNVGIHPEGLRQLLRSQTFLPVPTPSAASVAAT